VFARFLPSIPLQARKNFHEKIVALTQIDERNLAVETALYLSSRQLRDLKSFGFEIGNHTHSHVNCRSLLVKDFEEEIDQNKAVLEAVTERRVRSFSVPYGSSADLTHALQGHLERSGHEAIFLAEGCSNSLRANPYRLNRISTRSGTDAALFSQIEVLPRLRTLRNEMRGSAN
jgi:hypothetical protein